MSTERTTVITLPVSHKKYTVTYTKVSRFSWKYVIVPVVEDHETSSSMECHSGKAITKELAVMKANFWLTKHIK